MNAQEEKDRVLHSSPQCGLESPFLDKELFVAETESGWEPRLVTLQNETPFQHAFAQGRTILIKPEDLEAEFAIEDEWPDAEVGESDQHLSPLLTDSTSELQKTDRGINWQANSNSEPENESSNDFEYNFEDEIISVYEGESGYLNGEADSALDTLFEAEGGITGDDDRKEVRDTTIPPYRWICSVSYEKNGKTLDGGTGFLISNRHVLTAGHVITDAKSSPMAPSIYVYPSRHYGGEPFGQFSVAKTRVTESDLDFGLITLNRPVDQSMLWWGAPNTKTAWWSEALLPAQQLRHTAVPISTAGYPAVKDRQRRRMFEANGSTMPGAFGAIFRHTAATTEGQSGSPIWTVRNGLHVLIGIATSYDQMPGQRATWVEIIRRDIEKWMAEDAPKASKVERRIAIDVPYRWICRLEVYDNDLQRVVGFGTGLLISNRHVLTSARVIHGFSRDRRRYSVRVTPGYEFGKEAFGSTTAAKARVSPKFSPETKDGSVDYGLLTLSRPLGGALGSWGDERHGLSTTPADWSSKAAHVAAFSRSDGGGAGYHKLRVSHGAIVGLQHGQILHKASSKLDAPGAPIWIEAGKRRLLVGIVSSVFSKGAELNLGCYLSQTTQNQLMQWVNEDHEQTELEVRELSQDELEFVLASPDTEAEDWMIGETNPDLDPQGEFLEAESKGSFFGNADGGETNDGFSPELEDVSFEYDTPTPAPMSPFPPGRLSDFLKFDEKLWEAFKSARDSTKTDPRFTRLSAVEDIPIVIVALNKGGSRPTVGQNGVEMHYSGSLLKVAAMYAAYQLHVAVNDLAATPHAATIEEKQKHQLFEYIRATFNPQIDRAVPVVSQAPRVTPAMRIPKYKDIFEAIKNGGRWVLYFKNTGADNFASHLRSMIVGSHNESARFCIRALGYSWINGLLQKAGFFDAGTKNGIWLAGDYDNWPVVVIPSVNDGKAKQVTTCIDMARLFVLLHDHMLVKDDAPSYQVGDFRRHADMLRLLSDAVDDGDAPSLLNAAGSGFKVLHSKIGIGTLKKAPQGGKVSCNIPDHGCVQSEASILLHPPSGRKFVTVWQNVLWDAPDDGVRRVAAIIQKTMDNYKP